MKLELTSFVATSLILLSLQAHGIEEPSTVPTGPIRLELAGDYGCPDEAPFSSINIRQSTDGKNVTTYEIGGQPFVADGVVRTQNYQGLPTEISAVVVRGDQAVPKLVVHVAMGEISQGQAIATTEYYKPSDDSIALHFTGSRPGADGSVTAYEFSFTCTAGD